MHLTSGTILTLLAGACVLIQNVTSAVTDPIVELKQGKVKGKLAVSRNGKNFVQYKGLPYCSKPVRFQEAGPPEKWEGIRDGTRFGSACVQFDRKTKGVIGAEDCLFLNVYTPVIPNPSTSTSTTSTPSPATASKSSTTTTLSPRSTRSTKLPVLVYIHGGSFVSQSGQIFGAKYLMDESVILVTVNYRLGALGFISTEDDSSISNLGLRDQILALKWIKDNINQFGGDPNNVVLVGGSAGGAMASYLMLSPLAKNLFSKVISQSGNALCPWVIVREPKKIAQKLAAKLNCPTKTSKEIMACLKGKGLKDLEIARVSLQALADDHPAVPFAPVVEKWVVDKTKAVVPDTPQKMISEGNAMHIPWLTGYNSLNGLNLAVTQILTDEKKLAKLDTDWSKFAPIIFHYGQTAPNPSNVSEAIRSYYFGNGKITENKEKMVIALTDRNFISCTAEAAITQSKFSPVYLYTLNHQSAASFLDEWGARDLIRMRGVVHNDELPYLFNFFGFEKFPELKKGDKETAFSEKIVKLWSEFARSGKLIEKQDKVDFEWAPVSPTQSSSSLRYYELDSTAISQARTIVSPTFQIWEQVDLGPDEGYLRNAKRKIAVGYTMTERPSVKPLTNKPASSSVASGIKLASGGLPYALAPGSSSTTTTIKPSLIPANLGASSPTPSSSKATTSTTIKGTTSTTTTTTGAPGPAIHAVFKDEDPYSSTTTTTTKKPGILSKIFG